MNNNSFGIHSLQIIEFPLHETAGSFLVVYEGNNKVPFNIKRIFVVKSNEKNKRGFHAHKECSQLLVSLNGECLITCDDGKERKEFILNKTNEGILIPPTIWAEQDYSSNSTLLVLTDRMYDENDYIRDYNEFLNFRGNL